MPEPTVITEPLVKEVDSPIVASVKAALDSRAQKPSETKVETKSLAADVKPSAATTVTETKVDPKPEEKGGIKELRKAYETTSHELKESKKKLEEADGKLSSYDKLKEKVESLERDKKEYSELVARTNLQDHPEFKAKYTDRQQQLVVRAKRIVEESGGEPDKLETALKLSGKERITAIEDALPSMGDVQRGRFTHVLDELMEIEEARATELGNASESLKRAREASETRTRKQEQEMQARYLSSFEDAAQRVTKAHGELLGDEAKTAIEKGRELFTTNEDIGKGAETAIKGIAFDIVISKLAAVTEQRDKLQAEVDGYKEAGSRITSGSNGGAATGEIEGESLGARFARLAREKHGVVLP